MRFQKEVPAVTARAYIDMAVAEGNLPTHSADPEEPSTIRACSTIEGFFISRSATRASSCSDSGSIQDTVPSYSPTRLASRFFLREFVHSETPEINEETKNNSFDGVEVFWSSKAAAAANAHNSAVSWRSGGEVNADDTDVPSSTPTQKQNVELVVAVYGILGCVAAIALSYFSLLVLYWKCIKHDDADASSARSDVAASWRSAIICDVLHALLVLTSITRWFLLPWRLHAPVFARFSWCLMTATLLKFLFSCAFVGSAVNVLGSQRGALEKPTFLLLFRLAIGGTLSDGTDPLPGYSRLLGLEMCVFWCLYTWKTRLILVLPLGLTTTSCLLGCIYDLRSVFDLLLSFLIILVVCVAHHLLIDYCGCELYSRLCNERQGVAEESPCKGFFAGGFWKRMACIAGCFEMFEERVRADMEALGDIKDGQKSTRAAKQQLEVKAHADTIADSDAAAIGAVVSINTLPSEQFRQLEIFPKFHSVVEWVRSKTKRGDPDVTV